MESGFTQHHSKGLFTFYREQDDHPRKGKDCHQSSLAFKEPQQKRHHVSLSSYDAKKSKDHIPAPKEERPRKKKPHSQRYQQQQEEPFRKPLSTKHIFEPRIIEKSIRKNALFLQLIGIRNRVSRNQVENFLRKQARQKEGQRLVGELSARQLPASEVKQLFLPKKEHYAMVHAIKKSPLKLNAVTAHCVEHSPPTGEKMASVALNQSQSRRRNRIPSLIIKDAYEVRRQKLERGSFWHEAKLKRGLPSIRLNESATYARHATIQSQFNDSQLISPDGRPEDHTF